MDPLEIRMLHRRIDLLEQIVEQHGLADQIRFRPNADPAPDDFVRGGGRLPGRVVVGGGGVRPGPNVDPAPIDFSRFSKVQLQSVIHQIAAERTRLDAMEALVKEQLEIGG